MRAGFGLGLSVPSGCQSIFDLRHNLSGGLEDPLEGVAFDPDLVTDPGEPCVERSALFGCQAACPPDDPVPLLKHGDESRKLSWMLCYVVKVV